MLKLSLSLIQALQDLVGIVFSLSKDTLRVFYVLDFLGLVLINLFHLISSVAQIFSDRLGFFDLLLLLREFLEIGHGGKDV